MEQLNWISEFVETKKDFFADISDKIWDYAEIHFEEYQSSKLLCEMLENEGFAVERGIAGMETAFVGSFGHGKPVIAILGEFDALSNLSQAAGETQRREIVPHGAGHGCGHNLLGVGSLAGAFAVKHYLESKNLSGTVRYYGCPAEEGGSGKTRMVRKGVFSDVDCALTWHPQDYNCVTNDSCLAAYTVKCTFRGKSAHAAFVPHLGRSALDALELMNVAINFLREHIIPEAKIHYAITNAGGIQPNIVQAETEEVLHIRAPKKSQAQDIFERVHNIAKGAALMTGTEFDIQILSEPSNLVPNTTLAKQMYKNFSALGVPNYSAQDLEMAESFYAILSDTEKRSIRKDMQGKVVANTLDAFREDSVTLMYSTDVGDVSWVIPTVQCTTACVAVGTPPHNWKLVAQGKSSIAHKGMLLAGKVIAATAIDLIQQPQLVEKAKAELEERLKRETYIS